MFVRLNGLYASANIGAVHPAEMAIYAHAAIAALHPFDDGNGRTARVMQNALLESFGYPVAFLCFEDRVHYLETTDLAAQGYHAKDNRKFQPFGTLMYEQITRSFDHILSKSLPGKSCSRR